MTGFIDVTEAFGEFRAKGLTPDVLRTLYSSYLDSLTSRPVDVTLCRMEPQAVIPADALPGTVVSWSGPWPTTSPPRSMPHRAR
jgi:hypothetical protein